MFVGRGVGRGMGRSNSEWNEQAKQNTNFLFFEKRILYSKWAFAELNKEIPSVQKINQEGFGSLPMASVLDWFRVTAVLVSKRFRFNRFWFRFRFFSQITL